MIGDTFQCDHVVVENATPIITPGYPLGPHTHPPTREVSDPRAQYRSLFQRQLNLALQRGGSLYVGSFPFGSRSTSRIKGPVLATELRRPPTRTKCRRPRQRGPRGPRPEPPLSPETRPGAWTATAMGGEARSRALASSSSADGAMTSPSETRLSPLLTIGRSTLFGVWRVWRAFFLTVEWARSWWFASTAIPLLAATIGPMANVMSIAALVSPWRVSLPNNGELPEGADDNGIGIEDPRWCVSFTSSIHGHCGN